MIFCCYYHLKEKPDVKYAKDLPVVCTPVQSVIIISKYSEYLHVHRMLTIKKKFPIHTQISIYSNFFIFAQCFLLQGTFSVIISLNRYLRNLFCSLMIVGVYFIIKCYHYPLTLIQNSFAHYLVKHHYLISGISIYK